MNVIGLESARSAHLEELRRQAFVVAQVRRASHRREARLAAALRGLAAALGAFAARLELPGGADCGPWREDFDQGAGQRA